MWVIGACACALEYLEDGVLFSLHRLITTVCSPSLFATVQMNARRMSGIDNAIDRKAWLQWIADVDHVVTILEANPHIVRAPTCLHSRAQSHTVAHSRTQSHTVAVQRRTHVLCCVSAVWCTEGEVFDHTHACPPVLTWQPPGVSPHPRISHLHTTVLPSVPFS